MKNPSHECMSAYHKADLEAAIKLVLDAGLSAGNDDTCRDLMLEVLAQIPHGWTKCTDGKPPSGKKVLAMYFDSSGDSRRICAHWIERWWVECMDSEDECFEWSDSEDTAYVSEGWYENIENWGEFTSVRITEGEVVAWQELPKAMTTEDFD